MECIFIANYFEAVLNDQNNKLKGNSNNANCTLFPVLLATPVLALNKTLINHNTRVELHPANLTEDNIAHSQVLTIPGDNSSPVEFYIAEKSVN